MCVEVFDEPQGQKERVDFWDIDEIETLDTYQGKIRAVRAEVTKPDQEKPTTWCFAIIGERARQISRQTALRIIRARWHIENTAFNQWTQYCSCATQMRIWPFR